MQIILQGGHYDGDRTEIDEHVWQLAQYGNIYKIVAGEFMDGRQVFRFDEKATRERKYGKPNRPHRNADPVSNSLPARGWASLDVNGT